MFCDQVKEIKRRLCTNWVDINGVPVQEGVTEAVHRRDLLSSGVSPKLETLQLRDRDNFFSWWLTPESAWHTVLGGHPLAERGFVVKYTSSHLLVHF